MRVPPGVRGSRGQALLLDDVPDVHLGHLLHVRVWDLLLLLHRGDGGRGGGGGGGDLLFLLGREQSDVSNVMSPAYRLLLVLMVVVVVVLMLVLLGDRYLVVFLLRAGALAVGARSHLVSAGMEWRGGEMEREERVRGIERRERIDGGRGEREER